MTDSDTDNKAARFIPLILILLTVGAMSPLLIADFTNWDDRDTVTENTLLNPPALKYLSKFWDPNHPFMDIYIPLTYTIWAALAWQSYVPTADPITHTHLNPWVFHGANLTFHIIGVLAVYAILKLLIRRPWPAALGAALYAVHPVQVEPVAWVSGLKDVLCGCMGLLAIWQYLVFAKTNEERAEPAEGIADTFQPLQPYLVATLALLLSLLSKPSGVVVPLVAGVITLFLLRRPIRWIVITLVPWVLLTIPFVIEGRRAQPAIYLSYVPPLVARPFVAADALAYYLYKLVFPAKLTIIYNRTPQMVLLEHHWAYFTWVIPAAVLVALWIWRKRFPWLWAAVGVFWVAVLPVLGLVPFDFQDFSTVADHYLYLAMLGPALGLAFLLRHANQRAMKAGAILIAVLGVRTWFQSRVWLSSETLYRHAIALNPKSCGPYNNLAYVYRDQHFFDKEIELLKDGIREVPHCAQLQIHLAMVLGNQGELNEADRLFHDALMHTRVPNLVKLAEDGLAEVARARRTAATAPSTRKTTTALEPHLTPPPQPIK